MSDSIVRLVSNLPRRSVISPDAPGERIVIRILRECGRWRAGQTGSINAEYGRELIANRLAEQTNGPNVR